MYDGQLWWLEERRKGKGKKLGRKGVLKTGLDGVRRGYKMPAAVDRDVDRGVDRSVLKVNFLPAWLPVRPRTASSPSNRCCDHMSVVNV
jgi:hypothetical protein